MRQLDGVAADWPIDYTTLEPFYDVNDKMMGVSGLAGDPAYPPKTAPMPPIPLGRSGETLAHGFNQLGWHWWPSDMAIATNLMTVATVALIWVPVVRAGPGAKGSTDITYWPHAMRAGVELRTQCRVREVTVDQTGRATGAIYYDAAGNEQFQAAEMVVMACNGIGTPRILLNSTSTLFPDGLANSSGELGRNLMLHPYATVDGILANRRWGEGPA